MGYEWFINLYIALAFITLMMCIGYTIGTILDKFHKKKGDK